MQTSIVVFADDSGRDFTRLNAHRLVDHALEFGVVTHFHLTAEWEVFAEGVPNKAVVGQNAAQIVMTLKHDAKQIKGLTLVPVGRIPNTVDRIEHRKFIVRCKHFQAYTLVQRNGEQMQGYAVTSTFPHVITVG